MLTIDSGSLLIHVRGISGDDVHRWLEAFKQVKANHSAAMGITGKRDEDGKHLNAVREEDDEPVYPAENGKTRSGGQLSTNGGTDNAKSNGTISSSGAPSTEAVGSLSPDEIMQLVKKETATLADHIAELRASFLGPADGAVPPPIPQSKDGSLGSSTASMASAPGAGSNGTQAEAELGSVRRDSKASIIRKRSSNARSISANSKGSLRFH
jgi:hypothetical protein